SQTFDVGFDVTSALDMEITLEVADVDAMPTLRGNLTVDWDWSYGQRLAEPTVELRDLRIDVGSMIDDFLLPIAERIEGILSPFEPFARQMVTEIDGLDFVEAIGIEPTPLGLINGILKVRGYPEIPRVFFDAVLFMTELPEELRSWSETGEIVLGSIVGLGAGELRAIPSIVPVSAELERRFDGIAKGSSGGAGVSTGSGSGANRPKIGEPRSGFKMLEYIKSIENWKQIMSGGDAILFTYELPLLGFEAGADVPLARVPIGPLMLGLDAGVDLIAAADLAFGYDTYGIRQAIGSGNPLDALDGFFVHDFTLPTFRNGKIVGGTGGEEKDEFFLQASFSLSLSVSLGPIKGGGRGTLTFYAGVDLQDIAKSELTKDAFGNVESVQFVSDGRIRGSEIATMFDYEGGGFANLFNITLSADVALSVFVELDLWLTTVTFYEATLFRANLFDYTYEAPRVQPYLAEKQGDTLVLNFGDRAGERRYFGTEDGGEEVTLHGSGGTVYVEYDGWYQEYSGIRHVVGNLGQGDDTIDLTRLRDVQASITLGAGDDTAYARHGGGAILGGSGKDRIQIGYFDRGTVEFVEEEIDHGDGRIEVVRERIYTPGAFLAGVGTTQGWTLEGGDGDDVLTGAMGADVLRGGAGNDRLTGNGGRDALWGGTGNDRLSGGGGRDLYGFESDWGDDRVSDADQTSVVDFSAMGSAVTVTLDKRALNAVDEGSGAELRISSAPVDEIVLSGHDDTLLANAFPERRIAVIDTGGSDDYRIRMDRAGRGGEPGTIAITEAGAGFDEIVLEQTRARTAADALTLGTGLVQNGRETVTYQPGAVDRLTVKGKGAVYAAGDVTSFGGAVRFAAAAGQAAIDMGATELRALGSVIHQGSAVRAGGIYWESLVTITIAHDVTVLNSGTLDIRAYGDGSDVVLMADIRSSAGLADGTDGAGQMRIQVADGDFVNAAAHRIDAEGAYLMVKAKGAVGTFANPIHTRIAALTVATAGHGAGDVVIVEDDDLVLEEERRFLHAENPGLVVDGAGPETRWESGVAWTRAAEAADWRATLAANGTVTRPDVALEVSHGDLQIDLLGDDALLTLKSGFLRVLEAGRFITVNADDVDLLSGANRIVGGGLLTLRTQKAASDYFLGSHAQDGAGVDYAEDSPLQVAQPGFFFSQRDFAALADGFTEIRVGRYGLDNRMFFGDVKEAGGVVATLRDTATFLADRITVQGDVRATDDALTLDARLIQVQSQNVHDAFGPPDSGVTARDLTVAVREQASVIGWLRGRDALDLAVTGRIGDAGRDDAYAQVDYDAIAGPASLFVDRTGVIETQNDGATLSVATAHAIETAGLIEIGGTGARLDIHSGGPLILAEFARVRGI
ncbi:MAG: calcium-binding protein, partial [Hasllibacter sp.]